MEAKDQLKLLKAGFTIIRKEVTHMVGHKFTRRIKGKTVLKPEWHTLEDGFTTTKALEQRMKDYLQSPHIVAD